MCPNLVSKYSDSLKFDASQFDSLFEDGEVFKIGNVQVKVLHTPGHTSACSSYLMGDAIFVGDTLFMPDLGTAPTDFHGGSAAILCDSVRNILSLPDETRSGITALGRIALLKNEVGIALSMLKKRFALEVISKMSGHSSGAVGSLEKESA